ncbi:MAG: hypothetical protein EAZ89_11200 [Bacteroidetes bacterium]|nr:MAG: hypothetical protein EAZ89_11200 [Bacteroidota bacterium]
MNTNLLRILTVASLAFFIQACCPPDRVIATLSPNASSLALIPYQVGDTLVFVDSAGNEMQFINRDGWRYTDSIAFIGTFCPGNFFVRPGQTLANTEVARLVFQHDSFSLFVSCYALPIHSLNINTEDTPDTAAVDVWEVGILTDSASQEYYPIFTYLTDFRGNSVAPGSTGSMTLVQDTTLFGQNYPELIASWWMYAPAMYYAPDKGIVAFTLLDGRTFTLK